MVCTPLPGGGFACGPRRRFPLCKCCSGKRAVLACDWKIGAGKTCDAKLCEACTTSPAEGKDLCPDHAEAWEAWKHHRIAGNG